MDSVSVDLRTTTRDDRPRVVGAPGDDRPVVIRDPVDRPSAARRLVQVLVLLVPVAALAAMGWAKRNMYDDGFIYLHIVQNVLAGNGPVFNSGERVEAYTGPLWLGVLSLLGLLTPWALEWLAVGAGLVMTLAAVLVAMVGATRLLRPSAPTAFLLPLGMVVFASVAVVWTYTTTGLETGLTFLWLATCLWILARWAGRADGRVGLAGLVVLGLGPLVRPELALDSAVFLLILLAVGWRRDSWVGRVRVLAVALALPVAYQLFRMGYFGVAVSNTAIAKEGTMPRPDQGWAYLVDFVSPYLLVIPLAALAVGAYLPLLLSIGGREGWRAPRLWALLALPLAGAANATYIVVMGGDYLHGRLLLPAFFAVLAPVAVVPLQRRYAASLLVLPWAVICALTLRTTDSVPAPFGHIRFDGAVTPAQSGWPVSDVTAQDEGLYAKFGLRIVPPVQIDVPLAPGTSSPTLVAAGIGLQSYVAGTDVHIFDYLGLASVLPAHMELTERGLTGHEKGLPTPWIAAALTAPGSSTAPFDALQQSRQEAAGYAPLLAPATGSELQLQTEWARAALACPAIADRLQATTAALTVDTVARNLLAAVTRTDLRIPPDPQQAYATFCGPGTPPAVAALTGQATP